MPLIIFVDLFVRIYGKFNLTSDFKVSVIFVLFSAILTSFKGVARKIIILNLSWFSVLSNLGWAFIFVALTWKTKNMELLELLVRCFFTVYTFHNYNTLFLKRKVIDISMIFNIHVLTLIFVPMISIYVSFRIDSLILKAIACVVIMVFSIQIYRFDKNKEVNRS